MVAAWRFFGQFRLPHVLIRLLRLTNKLRLLSHTSEINCIDRIIHFITIGDAAVLTYRVELYIGVVRKPGAIGQEAYKHLRSRISDQEQPSAPGVNALVGRKRNRSVALSSILGYSEVASSFRAVTRGSNPCPDNHTHTSNHAGLFYVGLPQPGVGAASFSDGCLFTLPSNCAAIS